jgi:hypothetical protein
MQELLELRESDDYRHVDKRLGRTVGKWIDSISKPDV